jgi:hypothetical protein
MAAAAERETSSYAWTRTGMVVIAHLLRGTIQYNIDHGLNPDSLRKFPNTSKTTVRNYMQGGVHAPQQRMGIAAIAPHLYYYAGMQGGDEVLFDPTRKYQDWVELAEHVGTMSAQFGPQAELIDELRSAPVSGYVQQALVPPFVEAGAKGEQQNSFLNQVQSLMAQLLEQELAPIRDDLLELQRQQFQVVGTAIAQPDSAIEKFLDRWCEEATAQQLEVLNLAGTPTWGEKRTAILAALVKEGNLSPDRAEEIMSGDRIVAPEHFILGYLFSEPKTMEAYPLKHWDDLATAETTLLAAG